MDELPVARGPIAVYVSAPMSWENAYEPYQPRRESSGKAVTALVLGICGLVFCPFVLSVVAVVVATQARTEIRESRGRVGGAGIAQAGLVLGWVGVAIYGTFGILFVLVAASGGHVWINVG
jgi:hypothetical protein